MTKNLNNNYFQLIINSIIDPVIVMDKDFRIKFMNKAAEASARAHRPDTGTHQFCYEVTHGRQSPCGDYDEECPVGRVFSTGKPVRTYHRRCTVSGNNEAVEVTVSPVFGENSEVIKVVEVVRDAPEQAVPLHNMDPSLSAWGTEREEYLMDRDLTEHKRADEIVQKSGSELLQQHEELTRIFKLVEVAKREWEKTMDCISDLVILTDTDAKIKRCNRSVAEFTKKPYDALLGKNWKHVLSEQGLPVHGFHGEKLELYHERSGRWFIVNSYPVPGISDDLPLGNVISLHDTTSLKRITAQLELTNREINEHRELLQSALDEISSLIQRVEKEKTFNIRFTNPNLKKCYEIKNCSLKKCPCYGKDATRCWQVAGTYCGGKIQKAYSDKCDNCSDCEVFKAAACTPIFQIGEHFNNMMHILEVKNRELEDAYTELKLTQSKILQQEKMASIGQLAAGVAHEINNPMGFISSNLGTLNKYIEKIMKYARILTETVEGLKDSATAAVLRDVRAGQKFDFIVEDTKKLIAESLEGAARVKAIVQNLKNFSRVDESEARFADINECMESTINIAWNELKYKATLKKEYGKLPLIKCYPQQLNQVFMNLIVNAAHAIEAQGGIHVRSWERDTSIFVSVSDTGCGIPEPDIARIFEPFFTTKEVGKGTGLGLSIAYDIVKKHNGEITVRSEVGKGTTFTIRIPIIERRD